MLARNTACADCGVVMAYVEFVSSYFARALCLTCYRLERLRSRKETELFLLEHMYLVPSVA